SDCILKYSFANTPIFASEGSTMIPSCDFPNPISSSAQIIPCENSPRILDSLILKGSPLKGKTVVPTPANITFCPLATLGAPQTTCNGSPLPLSTVVIRNLSAFGCCSQLNTSAIIKPSSPPGTSSTSSKPSTSSPMFVNISDSSSGVLSIFKKSLSQLYDILIRVPYCFRIMQRYKLASSLQN